MKTLIALLSIACVSQVAVASYLQRFSVASQPTRGRIGRIVLHYPWLKQLEQPTASVEDGYALHVFRDNFLAPGLPPDFLSYKRTVLTYADGTVTTHHIVAEETPGYGQFKHRTARNNAPTVVSISDSEGNVQGEYIYSERMVNYLHGLFEESGFRFEDFLARVEPPVLNVAAGGYHFSYLLRKLSAIRQEQAGTPRAEWKNMTVFSFDISGTYRTFSDNPWYLFGSMYSTGLPDDTFGAVIALGGPLKRVTCPFDECTAALRELGRITQPDGKLLVEYLMPTSRMIMALNGSRLNYITYKVYEGNEKLRRGSLDRKTRLMEITLDK